MLNLPRGSGRNPAVARLPLGNHMPACVLQTISSWQPNKITNALSHRDVSCPEPCAGCAASTSPARAADAKTSTKKGANGTG